MLSALNVTCTVLLVTETRDKSLQRCLLCSGQALTCAAMLPEEPLEYCNLVSQILSLECVFLPGIVTVIDSLCGLLRCG